MNYFENPDNLALLQIELDSWIGSKYRHLGKTKAGVDCGNLIGAVLYDLSVITQIEDIYYSRDWYVHGNVELLLDSFNRHMALYAGVGFSAVLLGYPENSLLPGDVLCMRIHNKKCPLHHAAFYLENNEMCDALEEIGVSRHDFNYKWKERTKKFFRILKEE